MKLIFGDDEKLVNDYLQSTLPDFDEYQVVSYQNAGQIIGLLRQPSFFQDKLRIIIKDCTFISGKSDTKANQNLPELLNLLLQLKNEAIYLTSGTFNESSLSSEVERFIKQIETKQIAKLTKLTIKKYLAQCAQKLNLNLSSEIIDFLVSSLPLNVNIIKKEMEKVALIYHERLSVDEVQEIIWAEIDANAFRLLATIISGKTVEAIKLYDWLVGGKLIPYEVLQILMSQLFTLKIATAAFLSGMKPDAITKQMHLQPFFFKMWFSVLHTVTLKKFVKIFDKMCDMEIALRMGGVEPFSWVRVHIVQFCSLFCEKND